MDRGAFLARQDRVLTAAGVPRGVGNRLTEWAAWMHGDVVTDGHSDHSPGFASGGITCYDDWEESGDSYAMLAVNAAIDSLGVPWSIAIQEVWLGCGWRMDRLDIEKVATAAMQPLWQAIVARLGVV